MHSVIFSKPGVTIRYHEPLLRLLLLSVPEAGLQVLATLAEREGCPSHHVGHPLLRICPQVVQGPPEVEVGCDAKEALAQVDKNHDLRDGVRLEVCCLQHVVMKEPAEE
jgi:hypothetical protein